MRDLKYKVEAQPAACWFIIGVLGLFALMCWLAVLDRMSFDQADDLFMLAMALLLTYAIYRTYRYFRGPNLIIGKDSLTWRPFWQLQKVWTFDDIDRIATKEETVQPQIYTPSGRSFDFGGAISYGVMYVRRTNGKITKVVMPRYDPAEQREILQMIHRRSGKVVELHEGLVR